MVASTALNRDDCRAIFLNDVPMMDVRAPVEFARGAFPGVVNLPLMNDAERQAVGTCYKQQGQQAAIELGHRLVSGALKTERIAAWARFAQAHPDGLLYCFRGGLRSQIVQQWLETEAGIGAGVDVADCEGVNDWTYAGVAANATSAIAAAQPMR